MTHYMRLNNEPYTLIKTGQKTIELRLNDEKRRTIKTGDRIVFTNITSDEKLTATVINLYKFKDFTELYASLSLSKCGYAEIDLKSAKAEDMLIYYTKEQQEKYGVLGIEIKI